MKNSTSLFQVTLLKTIVVIYFLYLLVNSFGSSVSFFHDNSEFGIWTFISFLLISGFILFVDIAVIVLITKLVKDKNTRAYILIVQTVICVIVYLGINYMFKNAEKWNEQIIHESQTLQTDSASIPGLPN